MTNSGSLGTIIGPSILFALVYMTVFEILRVRWPQFFSPREHGVVHAGFLEWIPNTFLVPEEEVVRRSGMDAAVYLRVQSMAAFIMMLLTFFGCVVLMPVYYMGEEGLTDLNEISLSNVRQLSDLLWAPSVMMWVFTSICFCVIMTNYNEIYKMRLNVMGSGEGQEYSVMITKVPEHFDSDEKILDDIQKKYPGRVVAVQTIHDESLLEDIIASLKQENLNLLRSQQRKVKNGGRKYTEKIGPFSWVGVGKTVDPVAYHAENVKNLTEEAKKSQSCKGPFVGVAFVMFDSIATATKAGSTPLSDNPDAWIVQPAPKPTDIIWENVIKIPSASVKAMLDLTKSSALFTICIFWSIPVAFVNAFSNLHTLADQYPWLAFVRHADPFWQSVITGLLPGLLLVLLMLLLYPILWYFNKSTGILTYSELHYQFMRDYFFFLLIDVFFITLLSSSILDTINEIIDHPKSLFSLLGSSVPAVAIIEIGYILIQGLMVETERIVRVFFLLYAFVFHTTSTTEVEQEQASKPEEFAYGGNLAFSSLIFTICFCYSTIAPLILPFGLLYFSLNYIIKKYKLLYVHELPFETYGRFFPKVADFMFTGMIIGQVALMGVIGLKFGYWQQLILWPLPIFTYLLSKYLHSYYGNELSNTRLPLSIAAGKDARRSEERVRKYLREWCESDSWRQPAVSVDISSPLRSPRGPPKWESNRDPLEIKLGGRADDDDSKDEHGFSSTFSIMKRNKKGDIVNEHAPLLNARDTRPAVIFEEKL